MKVFVSGSLAYDRIMSFPGKFSDHLLPDKMHILNVCFLVDGLDEKFGGTAGNIAYTLSLLGEKATILSQVGKDFGAYEKWLTDLGLPLDGIKRMEDVLTAGAYITTDLSDNQITAFNPGAMNFQSQYDFSALDPKDIFGVAAPGNLADMKEYPRRYRDLGARFICDPGQNIPRFDQAEMIDLITGSEILISNDYELEMIMKTSRLDKNGLLEKTRAIITTLGEKGSIVTTRDGKYDIPAVQAKQVVDPTGAGDSYRSGLLKGLAMGKDLAQAALVGATAASFSVECLGTQEHTFTEEEFWDRYPGN